MEEQRAPWREPKKEILEVLPGLAAGALLFSRRGAAKRKKERKPANQTRDGRRTRSPPARAGSWKDDQGHRGTGVGSASRHGGGLGRVHPHDRVPGIPLSYRTGCTRRHGGRRGPPTGCALLVLLLLTRDSDRFAARWTPYSTGDLSRLATFLRFLALAVSRYHGHTDRGGRGTR